MRKIIAIALAAAFASIVVPTAEAETASRDYIGGLGASVLGVGPAFIFCYDPSVPPCAEAGMDVGLGGTDLYTAGFYSNTIVSLSDDIYGTDAASAPCFYHPEGDFTCDGDADSADGVQDYPGERGCGTQALLGAPFLSNFVSVFVFAVVVTEDLDTCGGSQGTATADLF